MALFADHLHDLVYLLRLYAGEDGGVPPAKEAPVLLTLVAGNPWAMRRFMRRSASESEAMMMTSLSGPFCTDGP